MTEVPEIVHVPMRKKDQEWIMSTLHGQNIPDRIHEVITLYRRHVIGERV